MKRPFCVGLTGGIGSGKSLVADMFATHGVALVDTDRIARALTDANGAAMPMIAQAFGPNSQRTDGALDRDWMAEQVFADDSMRRRLESILHPMIREIAANQVAQVRSPYVLLIVPLLVENKTYLELADRILVVDCSEAVQVERVMRRNRVPAERVQAIMAAQATREERLRVADDVIVNDGSLDTLPAQVGRLHARYLEMARACTVS